MAKKAKIIPASEATDVIDVAQDLGPVTKAVSNDHIENEVDAEAERVYQAALFRVKVPVFMTIANISYQPGLVYEVDRGTMEMIQEISDRKRRADLAVFTGKNHLVERLLDRTLKITEVKSLDFRK